MFKARRNEHIVFNGENIKLFQDLSQITLKNGRALWPLLDKLWEKDLRYTWHFPFALLVTHNGKQHMLRTPSDLPEFCNSLQLDQIDLPEWYQEFTLPPKDRSLPHSPLTTPEKHHSKKQKQTCHDAQLTGTPRNRPQSSKSTLDDWMND